MSSSSDDDSSSSEASDLTTASEFDAFADEDETSPKSPNNLDSQPQTNAFALSHRIRKGITEGRSVIRILLIQIHFRIFGS